MPSTLTLRNVPDEVYERLKSAAGTHRRSLASEAIACLKAVLIPGRVSPDERLARARALRSELQKVRFKAGDINAMKRKGRETRHDG